MNKKFQVTNLQTGKVTYVEIPESHFNKLQALQFNGLPLDISLGIYLLGRGYDFDTNCNLKVEETF